VRVSILVVALVACGDVEASQPPARRAAEFRSEVVDTALERASDVVRTRGFSREGEVWRGFLVDRGVATDELSMRSGRCYVVLAVGSSAIEELDLRLHESAGGEVARSGAGTTALRYCPSRSGTYFLTARARGAGLFAVRRFRGPQGLDIRLDDLAPPDEG